MNDADMQKIWDALSGVVNLEAQLNNFGGRSARAGKFWTSWLKLDKREADATKNMKAALAELAKLMKSVKPVLKDLDTATKLATKQNLAKASTAKEYRDKVLVKQLAALNSWEATGQKFVTSMNAVVAPFPFPKSPAALADVTVTYDSVKESVRLCGEMKKTLGRL